MGNVKTIGLVGGVASGKSLVAKMLVDLGAGRLDADGAGHELLAHDAQVRALLSQRWGGEIFAEDGTVDRKAIARRVFGSTPAAAVEREFLESVLHPRIKDHLQARAKVFAASGSPAVVLDAPLLLEAGWGPLCDHVLFIDVSREQRLSRARTRGWSDAEFSSREAAQWPTEKKRQHADFVISNDGTEAELRSAVQKFWQQNVVTSD